MSTRTVITLDFGIVYSDYTPDENDQTIDISTFGRLRTETSKFYSNTA